MGLQPESPDRPKSTLWIDLDMLSGCQGYEEEEQEVEIEVGEEMVQGRGE